MSHYGATLTAKGRLSIKPREGTQLRTELMLERLVRFDLAKANGTPILDEDLSRIFGRSVRHLNVIRKKVSYLAKRMELTTGIGLAAGQSVELTIARQKQILKEMLPSALRVVADNLNSKPQDALGRRMQTQIALEVLDREGSFPKISRTDSHLKVEHDFGSTDNISKDLLEAMEGAAQSSVENAAILESIEANKAFSNSKNLSENQQEKALSIIDMASATESVQ